MTKKPLWEVESLREKRRGPAWRVEDMSYVILRGTPNPSQRTPFYKMAFEFWAHEWSKIFAQIHPDFKIKEESFHGQTLISILTHKGKILALQTLSHHNLSFSEILKDPYFSDYSVGFLQNLKQQNIHTFQSMQNYIVGESFGPIQTGQNIAAILAGLGSLQQFEYNLKGTITLARKDNPSYMMCIKLGMIQVGPDIKMHNVPVGQMVTKGGLPYPNMKVQKAVNQLWKSRRSESNNIFKKGVQTDVHRENIL